MDEPKPIKNVADRDERIVQALERIAKALEKISYEYEVLNSPSKKQGW